jgi:hypothetical protein
MRAIGPLAIGPPLRSGGGSAIMIADAPARRAE